jgi:signal transduction histidine kinase
MGAHRQIRRREVTALGRRTTVVVEGGIRDPSVSSMSKADRGEATTRPSVMADSRRPSLRHVRRMPWRSSAGGCSSPAPRGESTEGFVRVPEVVPGSGKRGWRVRWFMGASLQSECFGVVSPWAANGLRHRAQTRALACLRGRASQWPSRQPAPPDDAVANTSTGGRPVVVGGIRSRRMASLRIFPVSVVEAGLPVMVGAGFVVASALLADVRTLGPSGYLLLVVGAASLLVRRTHPVAALAGTVTCAFAYDLLSYPGGLCTIAVGVALFAVADAGHSRIGIGAIIGVVGGFLAIGVLLGRGHVLDLITALWFAGWLVASLMLGETTRGRRAYLEEVEQRAVEAEWSREDEARRRAREERIRIARELHDVLAHRISMISVQSGVGAHLLDRDPDQARSALIAVNQASKEALQELRATLGLLRQVDGPEPRSPMPGLAQIESVMASTSAAGIDVQLDVSGEPRALPTGVDLAAYRIIQESLTNVLRHARAATARIAIVYQPADVVIQVDDDGRGIDDQRPQADGGNGLLGMRERAAALGGELEAGPLVPSGFRVRARLPLDGAP